MLVLLDALRPLDGASVALLGRLDGLYEVIECQMAREVRFLARRSGSLGELEEWPEVPEGVPRQARFEQGSPRSFHA